MRVCAQSGDQVSLRKLLPEAELLGAADLQISACCRDSRRVRPGSLFVALDGAVHDGHDFAAEAVARGCSAVLAQRPIPELHVPVALVSDTRAAYGRLCQALAGDPSQRLKVVAVTGTHGKTTTSCLIASVMTTAGHRVGILGSLGYSDGRKLGKARLATPPADQLARWLTRIVDNGCSHAVMEVSNHALEQSRVAGMVFDVACVTGVRRDHLDSHGPAQEPRRSTLRLLEHLAPEGLAVINADDPAAAALLTRTEGPVLTVAIRSAAEITATILDQAASEQTFLLVAGSEAMPVRTPMIGTRHVYHCLVAAAVGLAYGLDLPAVARGLEAVDYVPGRLQRIDCGQPFAVFVDHARTPDALTTRLETLREVSPGRLICVFGAAGERDRGKRPLMGQAVEAGADLAILSNDNPRSEDPQAILQEILDGFRSPAEAKVIPDRAEAIGWALAQAHPGDAVLIAGKGHETYQVVGRKRVRFDDCEVARAWLYANPPHELPAAREQGLGTRD